MPPILQRRERRAFGPDRLIYGGGFDERATAESCRRERERLVGLLGFLTPEARAKLLGGNEGEAVWL